MVDLLISTGSTLISAIIVGLWGILVIIPYKKHMKIYRDVLYLRRNYSDPRRYEGEFIPSSIMVDCIGKQLDLIEKVLDSVLEQKELSKFSNWFFKYEELAYRLNFLWEYTKNPIMLDRKKEFSNDYILDQEIFFSDLKKAASLPKVKIIFLFLIPAIVFIALISIAIYYLL